MNDDLAFFSYPHFRCEYHSYPSKAKWTNGAHGRTWDLAGKADEKSARVPQPPAHHAQFFKTQRAVPAAIDVNLFVELPVSSRSARNASVRTLSTLPHRAPQENLLSLPSRSASTSASLPVTALSAARREHSLQTQAGKPARYSLRIDAGLRRACRSNFRRG